MTQLINGKQIFQTKYYDIHSPVREVTVGLRENVLVETVSPKSTEGRWLPGTILTM